MVVDEGVRTVWIHSQDDLSWLETEAFWRALEFRRWVHPYDADGKRVGFKDIPKTIDDLADDPYRSLAGELRRAGGFAKDTTPFSEFLWADFLRRKVKAKQLAEHIAANAPLTNYAVMHVLPRITDSDPAAGYMMEAMISSIAQADPHAKARLRAFLDKKAGKVEHR